MIIANSRHLIRSFAKIYAFIQLTPNITQGCKYLFSTHNYMKTYTADQMKIHHGRVRIDENTNNYSTPQKIQQFIDKQNKLFSTQSKKWASRTQEYLQRINQRRDQRTQSTSQIYNDYQYFTTVNWYQGRQYTQIWRKHINKKECTELVLDIMKIPLIKKYYKTVELVRTVFSPCSKYVAFGYDLHNNEQISFMIKNIGKDHIVGVKDWEENRIKGVDNLVFCGQDQVFYTKVINYRPSQLWHQNFKTGEANLIYQQKNGQYYMDISIAKDGKHLILNSNSKQKSKIWTIDTTNPLIDKKTKKKTFQLKQLNTDKKNTKTYVNHNGKNFIIWRDNQQSSQICLLDQKTNKQRTIYSVDALSNQTITDIDVFDNRIVLYIRRVVSPVIKVIQLQDVIKTYQINLPYQFGAVHPGANQMLSTNTFLFYINNIFVYNQGYQYNFQTKNAAIKQQFIMTGPKFNVRDYVVTLHQVPTEDGQLVPLTTIVPKRNSKKRNKMLLHCYGYYGLAYQLSFNSIYWAALQNGWSLAYAHVRGGGEKGLSWHKQATKGQKYKNWRDLQDCVGFLLSKNFTHPNILILRSHSAGSITIWNTINRYPHLYKAVVMSYPFLDVLGSLLDSSKPLTQSDFSEFGNPSESLRSYNEIQSISPYENIQQNKSYPFVYLVGGTKDYRCPMDQIAKFVKKYRAFRTWDSKKQRFEEIGQKGLLVKVNQGSHEGLSDLNQQIKDGCQMLACMDYLIQQGSKDVTLKK